MYDISVPQQVGSYAYDGTGRLTSITHLDTSSNVLASYVYAYDVADRLTSETMNGLTRYYVYDATNQITSDDGTGLSYDFNGNRTNSGYVTGPNNQLLSDGTWTYSYDLEGSLVKKVSITTGETWTYGYDQRNQMTFAEQRATDGGTLLQRVDFGYDVFGNRISKVVAHVSGTTTQLFAYDVAASGMGNVWADLDGSGSLTTRRVFGDGVDQLEARITAAGVASWYLTDHLGSVVGIVSNATGALTDQVRYDAFGNVQSESNAANGDRYKFTGREFVIEISLQYNRARYLDPQTGRFTSEDPIGGSNLYVYAGNGPTNATDPSGLQAKPTTKPKTLPVGTPALDLEGLNPSHKGIVLDWWYNKLTEAQRQEWTGRLEGKDSSDIREHLLHGALVSARSAELVKQIDQILAESEARRADDCEYGDTIRQFRTLLPALLAKARAEQARRDQRAAELSRQIQEAEKKSAKNADEIRKIDQAIRDMWPKVRAGMTVGTATEGPKEIFKPNPNWDPTKDERAVALLRRKAQLEGDQKKLAELTARADELRRIANMDVEARFKKVFEIMLENAGPQAKEYVKELIKNVPQMAAIAVALAGVSAINPALAAGIGYLMFGHSILQLGSDFTSFLFGTLGARTEEDFKQAGMAGNNVVIQAGVTVCSTVGAGLLRKRMLRVAQEKAAALRAEIENIQRTITESGNDPKRVAALRELVNQKLKELEALNPKPAVPSPIPGSYINKKYVIDMAKAPAGSAANAAGYPRNGPWFWRQMLEKHPELFSDANKAAIRQGRAPRVDDVWIRHNPTHQSFENQRLIHHHIDQGPTATPLPESVHQKYHGTLHPE